MRFFLAGIMQGSHTAAVVIAVLLLCGGAAVAAAYLAPLPSFVKSHGTTPHRVATVKL